MADLIEVHVVPKAKRPGVEFCRGAYKVRVSEAPEKGKANKAVIKALAGFLGLPRSKLKIVRGLNSREKLIEVLE